MGDKIAKIYANTDQVSKHGDGYDFLCFKFNLMNQSFYSHTRYILFLTCS